MLYQKTCTNCDHDFTSTRSNAMYCRRWVVHQCVMCDEDYSTECKQQVKVTCSMSCSRKLTRQRQGEKNIQNCKRCGNQYQSQSHNAIYCGQHQITACEHCEQPIDNVCNATFIRFCSASCKNTSNREHRYVIKEQRACILCGDHFIPITSGNTRCSKDHTKHCGTCGGEYIPRTVAAYRRNPGYCDNICATLGQFGTKLSDVKLEEFKHIDKWAKTFSTTYDRKPAIADFQIYFGLQHVPPRADRTLFQEERSSFFESIVEYYVREQYPALHFEKIRQRFGRKIREIDIYFPELHMGFEVQDFASHHMTKNSVPSKYRTPKNGPRYHVEKRQLFQSVGITVHELWENNIRDGSFRNDVDKAIAAALSARDCSPATST